MIARDKEMTTYKILHHLFNINMPFPLINYMEKNAYYYIYLWLFLYPL